MEAAGPIANLLRTYVFSQPLEPLLAPKITALVSALAKLGKDVPSDVKEKLTGPGVPKAVSGLFD
jgi:hypothetical protein